MIITGFDIDDAEFIGDKFAFVVRIEDVDLGDRAGQVRAEDGVEKMDEQVAVVLSAQQGFEDTVGFELKGSELKGSAELKRAKGVRAL